MVLLSCVGRGIRADYLAHRAERGLCADLQLLATSKVAVATVSQCVVPAAHGVALAAVVPESLLAYVAGPLPGDNFLSDYCRFCWDVQHVPTADSVLHYMGQVIKFCSRHLGVDMKPPVVLLDALKRQAQAPRERVVRQPCPVEVIAAVALDEAVPMGVRLAVVLLWFGGFRTGELLSARVLDFDDQFCLRRQDCTVAPDGSMVSLYFRKNKSDPSNQGGFRYIQAAPPGAALCPVSFVSQYLAASRGVPDDFPLLLHPPRPGGGVRCVTRAHVTRALKAAGERLGIDTDGLACHAVRTGHATALLAAPEVTRADLLMSCGWTSEGGPTPYHRTNGPAQRRVADALAVSEAAARIGLGAQSGWLPSGAFGVGQLQLRVSSRRTRGLGH
jgi:integrase